MRVASFPARAVFSFSPRLTLSRLSARSNSVFSDDQPLRLKDADHLLDHLIMGVAVRNGVVRRASPGQQIDHAVLRRERSQGNCVALKQHAGRPRSRHRTARDRSGSCQTARSSAARVCVGVRGGDGALRARKICHKPASAWNIPAVSARAPASRIWEMACAASRNARMVLSLKSGASANSEYWADRSR